MGYEFDVTITGARQGLFKGDATGKQHQGKIQGLSFSYEVLSPRDAVSGQAVGRHRYKPITFLKAWDAATPRLFQALVTNEMLRSIVFEFYGTTADGAEKVRHTITLTDASVEDIRLFTGNVDQINQYEAHDLEEVSLIFQKIRIQDNATGLSSADSLNDR